MSDTPTIGLLPATQPLGSVGSLVGSNVPTFQTETVGRIFTAKYPSNLCSPPFDKWIMFSAMSGRHVIRNQTVGEMSAPDIPLRSVGLYLPEQALVSTTAVAYDPNDLGPMVGAMVEFAAQGGTNLFGAKGGGGALEAISQGFKDVSSRLQSALGDSKSWAEFLKADVATLMSNLVDLTGSKGDAAIGAALGQKPNPRTDILYNAQEYRTHELKFLLVPRSLEEAKAIDTICYFFNYYMLPRYQSTQGLNQAKVGAFMIGFPYEFEINMYAGQNDGTNKPLNHINRIGRSVLKSVAIDHAAGGKTAFIKADTGEFYPVATQLELSFQEVRLLARDDDAIKRSSDTPSFDNTKDDPRA